MPEIDETVVTKDEMDALLGDMEKEKVEEITVADEQRLAGAYKTSMLAATDVLSQILKKQVKIENPKVQTLSPQQIEDEIPKDAIVVEVEYVDGLKGMTYILFLKEHGMTMADLATGGDGTSPGGEMTEAYMGALADAVGKMIDAANSSLSTKTGKTISSQRPPKIKVIDFATEEDGLAILKEKEIVRINYNLTVGDLFDGNLLQLMPVDMAKPIVKSLSEKEEKIPEEEAGRSVQFAKTAPAAPELPQNLQLLMDVPVEVTVELGKSQKYVQELLRMGPGDVIELDRLAGEPVDVLVNGKLIAKAGVVVVDENFGIRIANIINREERLSIVS